MAEWVTYKTDENVSGIIYRSGSQNSGSRQHFKYIPFPFFKKTKCISFLLYLKEKKKNRSVLHSQKWRWHFYNTWHRIYLCTKICETEISLYLFYKHSWWRPRTLTTELRSSVQGNANRQWMSPLQVSEPPTDFMTHPYKYIARATNIFGLPMAEFNHRLLNANIQFKPRAVRAVELSGAWEISLRTFWLNSHSANNLYASEYPRTVEQTTGVWMP